MARVFELLTFKIPMQSRYEEFGYLFANFPKPTFDQILREVVKGEGGGGERLLVRLSPLTKN